MSAQKITGSVTDKSGSGIPGVLIQVLGTTVGSVTDLDGSYAINAKSTDTLSFTAIGLETVIESVGNRSVISIVMEESALELGEVVLTALGIKKKPRNWAMRLPP